MDLPRYEDVVAAAERLEGYAVKTPVVESTWLNDAVGGRVFVKAECLQRTGSFKFRGAWNFISQLDRKQTAGKIVAYSSGNHAQGVAAAAALMDIPAVIIMPGDAPEIKLENTRALGAQVVTYDRETEDRDGVAQSYLKEPGAILVPPFEHKNIIAGQGTAALELFGWLGGQSQRADQLLVPIGGGGLIGGSALVAKKLSPQTKLHGVEPAGFDDFARSLAGGQLVANEKTTGSICDALMSPMGGKLTFAVNQPRLSQGLVVTDDEVRTAMRFAFERLKLVIEPGGAVTLAAVLSGKIDCADKNTAIIVSGGNVDAALFGQILTQASAGFVTGSSS